MITGRHRSRSGLYSGVRPVDLYDVNLTRVLATGLIGAAVGAMTACGGGHAITPGQSDAAAACRGSGSAAALAATKAAAVNPGFSTLAADENALAAGESPQASDLSDGDPSDDAGVGAVASAVDLGSAARQKVIADCFQLGLPVAQR
jgi:hypothetical protein